MPRIFSYDPFTSLEPCFSGLPSLLAFAPRMHLMERLFVTLLHADEDDDLLPFPQLQPTRSSSNTSTFSRSPNSFNMFSRLAAFVALASPLLAVATPAVVARNEPASDCNTAPIQCCDTVTKADSAAAAGVLGPLGIVVQDVNVLVGLTCSPISVIGVGSAGCSASPVCCQDNSHGGLISVGCIPVTL
ncbi:unnamed protein product [Somion occarium]|uniref:Hydrophobin n=1 Tax=Somion occarium TaxID=3059160 RepID=A0ABP1CZ13_9APHY